MNIRPFIKAPDVGKKGDSLLRTKPSIEWEKDRGEEPLRDEAEFAWFCNGSEFTGNQMNDMHLSLAQMKAAQINA